MIRLKLQVTVFSCLYPSKWGGRHHLCDIYLPSQAVAVVCPTLTSLGLLIYVRVRKNIRYIIGNRFCRLSSDYKRILILNYHYNPQHFLFHWYSPFSIYNVVDILPLIDKRSASLFLIVYRHTVSSVIHTYCKFIGYYF